MSTFIFPPDDADHPAHLMNRLLETFPEFADLRDFAPKIAVIFRDEDYIKQNRVILGMCYIPGVQGSLSKLFDDLLADKLGFAPDFLIVLSKPYWDLASDREREILMFHEMKHMGQQTDKYGTPKFNLQTGEPVFGLIAHDLEEFNDVVRRYGAWASDIQRFIDAADSFAGGGDQGT